MVLLVAENGKTTKGELLVQLGSTEHTFLLQSGLQVQILFAVIRSDAVFIF